MYVSCQRFSTNWMIWGPVGPVTMEPLDPPKSLVEVKASNPGNQKDKTEVCYSFI